MLKNDLQTKIEDLDVDKSKNILSDIIVFNKYSQYNKKLKRRENWDEIVTRNKNMHIKRYPHLKDDIEKAYKYVYDKVLMPSMRSLQFSGKAILRNPARIYNCSYLPIDDVLAFSEITFLLLSGCGVGYSVSKRNISKLPTIKKPLKNKIKRFLVGDSIEGWSDAIKSLMNSYFNGGYDIYFDYSDIRPEGAELKTSGGRAPGYKPLKNSIDKIKEVLDKKNDGDRLTSIEVHDIICHIADMVLSGGIRRSALICLFDEDDDALINCKSNFKIISYKKIPFSTSPVDQNGESYCVYEYESNGVKYYNLEVEFNDIGYGVSKKVINFLSEYDLKNYIDNGFIPWYYVHPQRGRANNSIHILKSKVNKDWFYDIFDKIEKNKTGEPGFYFSNDDSMQFGTNPCGEIALRPFQFCNLVEINLDAIKSEDMFKDVVECASLIGTLQASYTDFHYLRPIWKETTEKEALIGISLTGIASVVEGHPLYNSIYVNKDFSKFVDVAKQSNEKCAKLIGINNAKRITTIKPSGTASLVVGSSSGIHPWFSNFYIRRVRILKTDPLYRYLSNKLDKDFLEDDVLIPNTAIISIPIKSPNNAIDTKESAVDMLERIKTFYNQWITPGSTDSINTNNISATVYIRDNEWNEVREWMFNNMDYYYGISLLPFDGGTYIQAPLESISEDRFYELIKKLKNFNINLDDVIEETDNTDLKGEISCGGGACDIV